MRLASKHVRAAAEHQPEHPQAHTPMTVDTRNILAAPTRQIHQVGPGSQENLRRYLFPLIRMIIIDDREAGCANNVLECHVTQGVRPANATASACPLGNILCRSIDVQPQPIIFGAHPADPNQRTRFPELTSMRSALLVLAITDLVISSGRLRQCCSGGSQSKRVLLNGLG